MALDLEIMCAEGMLVNVHVMDALGIGAELVVGELLVVIAVGVLTVTSPVIDNRS